MTFTYTRSVPNPPNFPSQDVGNMQINTNSIYDIIDKDHFTFGSPGTVDGTHRRVSLSNIAAPGVPGTTNAVLFANNPAGTSQPFWQIGVGAANIFQIPTFPTATPPSATQNGFSYLPGGILMQWGFALLPASGSTINFPTPFVGVPFSITVTPFALSLPMQAAVGAVPAPTNAGFTILSSGLASIYWVAIGV